MSRRRRLLVAALAAVVTLTIGYAGLAAIVRHQAVALPAPAGPYPIGRATFQWTDDGRADPLAPTPGQPRRLAVWLWYPAAASAGGTDQRAAAYLPGAWARARSGPFWGHAVQDPGRILDHAVADAPVPPGPLRVLMLLPGLGLAAPDYAAVAEDLASRGYAVLGVTPTYSANATVLDGRLVAATDSGKNADDRLADVWATDASFALGRLAAEPRFAGALDLRHVGMVGHSFGGASAVEDCRRDARCVAAADVDGQPFGEVVRAGTDRPFLMVGSERLCAQAGCADMPGLHGMLAATRGPVALYQVRGAQHFNFTDLALYHFAPPLRRILPVGSIDPATALTTETDLLDAFFGHAFGGPDGLAQAASRHPQVSAVTG